MRMSAATALVSHPSPSSDAEFSTLHSWRFGIPLNHTVVLLGSPGSSQGQMEDRKQPGLRMVPFD